MTRRNYRNERYTSEENIGKGQTRKSASKAKPAKEAASTVLVKGKAKKTRKELRNEADRQAIQRQARIERKYGAVAGTSLEREDDTARRVRKWRIIWWGCIILGVGGIILTWVARDMGQVLFFTFLITAYAAIIAALVIEFAVIRRIRNKAQKVKIEGKVTKKRIRHEIEQQRLEEERRAARKQQGLLGGLRKKKSDDGTAASDLPFQE